MEPVQIAAPLAVKFTTYLLRSPIMYGAHIVQKGRGCTLFSNTSRPLECNTFACDWLKGRGTLAQRPDQSKIILDSQDDSPVGAVLVIFEVTQGGHNSPFCNETIKGAMEQNKKILLVQIGGRRVLCIPKGTADPRHLVAYIDIQALGINVTTYELLGPKDGSIVNMTVVPPQVSAIHI